MRQAQLAVVFFCHLEAPLSERDRNRCSDFPQGFSASTGHSQFVGGFPSRVSCGACPPPQAS